MPLSLTNAHDFLRKKRARGTMSAGQGSRPGPEAEADTGRASGVPPTEGADGLSTTNSEVESALSHRRHRTVLHDACLQEMRISVLLEMA